MSDPRVRQVLVAAAVIAGLAGGFALLGWATTWPGFAGELARTMAGIFTTPTLLEPAFLFLGLLIVLFVNHWRHQREGSEWVHLEQVAEPNQLPDHARFAIYPEPPLDAVAPDPLSRAEGALAIGDPAAATEALAELSPEQLDSPAALAARAELAHATGREDLATRLEQQLAARQQP